MTRMRTRRLRRLAPVALLASTLLAAGALATAGMPGAGADTAGNPATTVATTSTQVDVSPATALTGLADLSNVHVKVTAAAGTNHGFEARLCRSGVNIVGNSGFVPLQGGNCILDPITAGSDSYAFVEPDGDLHVAEVDFKVGQGTATWNTPNGERSVTCDDTHPCALWLKEQIGASTYFVHFELNYGNAPTFSDVPPGAPFYADITWLVGKGITSGYPNGTFQPTAPVSRQAMAAFLYRFAGKPLGDSPTCGTAPFSDVPVGAPFCGEITWLVDQGVTSGYANGTFQPAAPVSRQAMAAFLYRFALKPLGDHPTCASAPFTDVPVGAPFCGEIKWLVDQHIASGYPDGTYKATNSVSRQAMAAFLHRLDGVLHPA